MSDDEKMSPIRKLTIFILAVLIMAVAVAPLVAEMIAPQIYSTSAKSDIVKSSNIETVVINESNDIESENESVEETEPEEKTYAPTISGALQAIDDALDSM